MSLLSCITLEVFLSMVISYISVHFYVLVSWLSDLITGVANIQTFVNEAENKHSYITLHLKNQSQPKSCNADTHKRGTSGIESTASQQ